MAQPSLASKILEGALDWVKRLPSALSSDVAVDVGRKRVRLSHARVEALARQVLAKVKPLQLHSWEDGAEVYDVRFSVSGWRLRAEVTLERLELASGSYKVWLRTPGKVELDESKAGSLLVGVLRMGAGQGAVRTLAEKLLPPSIRWDGKVLVVQGKLPKEGVISAQLFENSSLSLSAEHSPDGLWLAAEEWPNLIDLLQAILGTDLPRKAPGS